MAWPMAFRASVLLLVSPCTTFAPRAPTRPLTRVAFDAGSAGLTLDLLLPSPAVRAAAVVGLIGASFVSKVSQSPLQRPKARVKPAHVSKEAWRRGEVARWALEGLGDGDGDAGVAVAFAREWAKRACEVGELSTVARAVPLERGVRLLWASRGPGYLSAPEERALERSFERLTPGARDEADRARSTYAYASRASAAVVGGLDLVVARGAAEEGAAAGCPTLSATRCGYAADEPIKETSERIAERLLSRDLKFAFGARAESPRGPDPAGPRAPA